MKESVKIVVGGNEYEISYPNVGQYARIESLKESLSNGTFSNLLLSRAKSATHAVDIYEVESVASVLCPQLMTDLKVKNFGELGMKDFKAIRDEFYKVVYPFFSEIEGILNQ